MRSRRAWRAAQAPRLDLQDARAFRSNLDVGPTCLACDCPRLLCEQRPECLAYWTQQAAAAAAPKENPAP
jgi:hypothetical protein